MEENYIIKDILSCFITQIDNNYYGNIFINLIDKNNNKYGAEIKIRESNIYLELQNNPYDYVKTDNDFIDVYKDSNNNNCYKIIYKEKQIGFGD